MKNVWIKVFCFSAILLLFHLASKANEVSENKDQEPQYAILDSGWILCENLTIGLNTKIGKAYLRSIPGFESEIFSEKGVVTSLYERLDEKLVQALKSIKKAPEGFPPEFMPDEKAYAFLKKNIRLGEDGETLFAELGMAYAGKPLFDIYSQRPIVEFYWKEKDGEHYFGAVINDQYTIERLLLKKIPDHWR